MNWCGGSSSLKRRCSRTASPVRNTHIGQGLVFRKRYTRWVPMITVLFKNVPVVKNEVEWPNRKRYKRTVTHNMGDVRIHVVNLTHLDRVRMPSIWFFTLLLGS